MKFIKLFVIGFALAGLFHLFQIMSCDSGDPVSLGNNPSGLNVDMAKVNEAAAKVETAFNSGNPDNVKSLLTKEALENNPNLATDLTADRMKSFASDFSKRSLSYASELFIEYKFPFQGTVYTVHLAMQRDGSYKLCKF